MHNKPTRRPSPGGSNYVGGSQNDRKSPQSNPKRPSSVTAKPPTPTKVIAVGGKSPTSDLQYGNAESRARVRRGPSITSSSFRSLSLDNELLLSESVNFPSDRDSSTDIPDYQNDWVLQDIVHKQQENIESDKLSVMDALNGAGIALSNPGVLPMDELLLDGDQSFSETESVDENTQETVAYNSTRAPDGSTALQTPCDAWAEHLVLEEAAGTHTGNSGPSSRGDSAKTIPKQHEPRELSERYLLYMIGVYQAELERRNHSTGNGLLPLSIPHEGTTPASSAETMVPAISPDVDSWLHVSSKSNSTRNSRSEKGTPVQSSFDLSVPSTGGTGQSSSAPGGHFFSHWPQETDSHSGKRRVKSGNFYSFMTKHNSGSSTPPSTAGSTKGKSSTPGKRPMSGRREEEDPELNSIHSVDNPTYVNKSKTHDHRNHSRADIRADMMFATIDVATDKGVLETGLRQISKATFTRVNPVRTQDSRRHVSHLPHANLRSEESAFDDRSVSSSYSSTTSLSTQGSVFKPPNQTKSQKNVSRNSWLSSASLDLNRRR